jgi:hypothetical protein
MELPLPIELENMIRTGYWPSTPESERAQNLKSLVSKDCIVRFAPEEDRVFFHRPPFHSVEERLHGQEGTYFWKRPEAAIHEIDPTLALVIGDFGLGSDAPIILDYRHNRLNPSILRLRWSTDKEKPRFSDNHWVKIANDFAEFAGLLAGS